MATTGNGGPNIDTGYATCAAAGNFAGWVEQEYRRLTKFVDEARGNNAYNAGVPCLMGEDNGVEIEQTGVAVDHLHRYRCDLAGQEAALLVEPFHFSC